MKSTIIINDLRRSFTRQGPPAVDGVDLTLKPGEIHALTGESGSGKSTVLRILAGFETSESGGIRVNGKPVLDLREGINLSAEKRKFGLVFQDHALFPHLTVAQNIGYGLPARLRKTRVPQLLEMIHLEGLADRFPHEISGGQAQRVALARALAPEPDLLLMDEPFNSLDGRLKRRLLPEIRRTVKATGIPTLFVSHDREEVFDLADTISVIRQGKILQTGKPEELYLHPVNRYVADFFGEAGYLTRPGRTGMIRPESLSLGFGEEGVRGIIRETRYRGNHAEYLVELEEGEYQGQSVLVHSMEAAKRKEPGTEVRILIREEKLHIMDQPDQENQDSRVFPERQEVPATG